MAERHTLKDRLDSICFDAQKTVKIGVKYYSKSAFKVLFVLARRSPKSLTTK